MQNPAVSDFGLQLQALAGRVVTGVGKGAGFTQLDWVRVQCLERCGVDPFPGTLNLTLESVEACSAWRRIRAGHGITLNSPSPEYCNARLFPVRIAKRISAAVVVPEVDGYPEDQVEIVAAVALREAFGIADGDVVEFHGHAEPRLKAVVFDVDGTLINSLDGYQLAASRATCKYGYSVSLDDVRSALDTNQPFWDFVVPPGRRRDPELIAELRAATMRHWPAALEEVVRVLPGCAETLHELRRRGLRLGIFTGSGGESLPPLEAAGLLELFEFIVTGNDIRARKPDPDGVLQSLERLGLPAGRVAYVGDSSIDVAASLAAGVLPIGVLSGAGHSASLHAAGAWRVLPSIARLPDLLPARAG